MIESYPSYSVARDEQGRWLFGLADVLAGLPTVNIPNGALAYVISTRLLYTYTASTASWGVLATTLDDLTVADDLTVTDDLTVGGDITGSGSISDGTASLNGGALAGATVNGLALTDNIVFSVRKRVTIAEANAGVTLVAGIAGQSVRPVYASMAAIGGAVGGADTVDISVETSGTKLFQGLQASLLENVHLDSVDDGLAPLAAGLTYVAQTAGKGVEITVTGSDITTATHIDVVFLYNLVAS